MKLEKQAKKIGDSIWILVPEAFKQHLGGLEHNDEIYIQDDDGKHGKFVSFWKKNQKK